MSKSGFMEMLAVAQGNERLDRSTDFRSTTHCLEQIPGIYGIKSGQIVADRTLKLKK